MQKVEYLSVAAPIPFLFRHRYMASKEDEFKLKMRNAKLNLIFDCLWSGSVQIKALGIGNGVVWNEGFSVLQQTRLGIQRNSTQLSIRQL